MRRSKPSKNFRKGNVLRVPAPLPAELTLADIEELVRNDKLDQFLDEHDIADSDEPLPAPLKFGQRPAFDRSTFDIEAYTRAIELEFKKI